MFNLDRRGLLLLFIGALSVLGYNTIKSYAATSTPPARVDCSGLNGDEQQFAYGLTPENRTLFCKKFTPVQRAAAMQLTSQPDPTGALLSPDQAVAIVAAANNLTPATNSPAGCNIQ